MRVAIASRIYLPEPAAASYRLAALVKAFEAKGHHVEVLTSRAPKQHVDTPAQSGARVRRWPVLRDKDGYVRGYLQYASFDLPLLFRLLIGQRFDLIVAEPPPTTGVMVRIVSAIRKVPYGYYAADIWSDAAQLTGAAGWIVGLVRKMELFALRGASVVLSVSEGVTNRLSELGVTSNVETIGNGIDPETFSAEGDICNPGRPYVVYAGTASEWHGAGIFITAFKRVLGVHPNAMLVFVGQGSERSALERAAAEIPGDAIHFEPQLPSEQVAAWMRGAVASLASVRPNRGYDFAFPTKMYASVACGAPLIYAGVGPGRDFVRAHDLGWAADYDERSIANAIIAALDGPPSQSRRLELSLWAKESVSSSAVASLAVEAFTGP